MLTVPLGKKRAWIEVLLPIPSYCSVSNAFWNLQQTAENNSCACEQGLEGQDPPCPFHHSVSPRVPAPAPHLTCARTWT